MIRRRSGQGWELVRQPDHGVLACALLDALTAGPRGPLEGFRLAVAHHDDGWFERDRTPRAGDDDGPETFLELALADHLERTQASVDGASRLDPYAEAIVALHGAWLHGSRMVEDAAVAVERDATVARWRALAEQRAVELCVPLADLHYDQRLCAMVDFMSLWLCGWPEGDELELERPDGDELEGPDSDDVDVTRAGDTVYLPVELLAHGCDLVVPVVTVGGTAPFPIVSEAVRTITLSPRPT